MSKPRLAYIGDSPFINTGFGNVAKGILPRLAQELDVYILGVMMPGMPSDTRPYAGYTPVCRHDTMGFQTSVDFIQNVNPDLLFMIGDPGSLFDRFRLIMITGRQDRLPSITYFPTEGAPLSPAIVDQAKIPYAAVTYTEWGKGEFEKRGVHVHAAPHGIDHGAFRQFAEDDRDTLRDAVGWSDKFVVGMVGVNKRTNRQPAILEAARILKSRGIRDVIFYLHCQMDAKAVMNGWQLDWMIEAYGVEDMIVVKPDQNESQHVGRPLEGTSASMTSDEMYNLSKLGYIPLLNCFDLYLDPASAHGWNLPASEAARCGIPVATVDDGFARSEIFGGVAHMMRPTAADWWHTGALLPLVSPKVMADTVEMFMKDREYGKRVAADCKAKFDSLSWQPTADFFLEIIMEAHEQFNKTY